MSEKKGKSSTCRCCKGKGCWKGNLVCNMALRQERLTAERLALLWPHGGHLALAPWDVHVQTQSLRPQRVTCALHGLSPHSCLQRGLDSGDHDRARLISGGPRVIPAWCTLRRASEEAPEYVCKRSYSFWKGDGTRLVIRSSREPAEAKWCCFPSFWAGLLISYIVFSVLFCISSFLKQRMCTIS